MSAAEKQYVVVATAAPLPERVDRSHWPSHVTVGNFRLSTQEAGALPALLDSVSAGIRAFEFRLGPADLFGRNKNIPVLLATHPAFFALHAALATSLSALPGFAPIDPEHWKDGYRPHLTLTEEGDHHAGGIARATVLALFELDGSSAHRVALTELS